MILTIESDNKFLQEDFCTFLVEKLQEQILLKLSNTDKNFQKKLDLYQEYINSENFPLRKNIYGLLKFDIRNFILQATQNLQCTKSKNIFTITLNSNNVIPGTFIKFETFCKFIDDGNLELKGLHLFSESFKKIEDNINYYIDIFLMGGY